MALWNLTDTQLSKPKYLDRGQVLALNLTNAGSGYTAVPTFAIPAPASGTQATGTAIVKVATVAVNAGGTAWTVNDTFTVDLDNAAGTVEAVFRVTEVEAGAVTTAVIVTDGAGSYTHITPANLTGVAAVPVSVADEDAASLTVDLTLNIRDLVITNPGGGYVPSDLTNGVLPLTFSPNGTTSAASAIVRPYIADHSMYTDANIVFVDEEEAAIPDNRARGLRSPGWWLYYTKTDGDGTERYLSELLVAADVLVSAAGDASDDEVAPEGTIVITVANTKVMNDGATSTIAATVVSTPAASLSYQWQVYGSSWTNLANATFYSGVTTATLSLTAPDYSLNGKRFRLKVTATGRRTTYSNIITLSITPATLSFLADLAATREGSLLGTLTLEVNAVTAPTAGLAVNYVWEKSEDAGETWIAQVDQAPENRFIVPAVGTLAVEDDGTQYRVTISRAGAVSVTSSATTIVIV